MYPCKVPLLHVQQRRYEAFALANTFYNRPRHTTLTSCLHHNDTDVESSISWSTWFGFTNANKATISQGTVSLSDRTSYQKMKQSLGTLRLDVCMYLWPCQEGIFIALQQSLQNFCKKLMANFTATNNISMRYLIWILQQPQVNCCTAY